MRSYSPCVPMNFTKAICRDLPAEIEGGGQTIIPSYNLEPNALAIQHSGSGSRLLDLIRGGPARGVDELVPAFEWAPCLRVVSPKPNERIPSNYSHAIIWHVPQMGPIP